MAPAEVAPTGEPGWEFDPERTPILVVDDSPEMLLLYERFLKGTAYQVIPASSVKQAQQAMQRYDPKAIVLDLQLKNHDTWTFLARLKQDEATKSLPVIAVSNIEDQAKAIGLGADTYRLKPIDRRWLLEALNHLVQREVRRTILLIDDDQTTRYWLKTLLVTAGARILETSHGLEAIRLARELRPQLILLDLVMPVMPGEEVLELLKADPATEGIPVIVVTSKHLQPSEREVLKKRTTAILSKVALSGAEGLKILREALEFAGWGTLVPGTRG